MRVGGLSWQSPPTRSKPCQGSLPGGTVSGFRDFDELVTRTPKALPIAGKLYTFPDRVSAETGTIMLALQRYAVDPTVSTQQELLDRSGLTPEQLAQVTDDLLGDTLAQLVADGNGGAVGHVIRTLTAWHLYGQEAAEQAWNSLGPTPAPNRAARRATATSSRRRASTAGTTPRPAKAARRGSGSSSSGA